MGDAQHDADATARGPHTDPCTNPCVKLLPRAGALIGLQGSEPVAVRDCQLRRITKPYNDAQNRLICRDKTCLAHT